MKCCGSNMCLVMNGTDIKHFDGGINFLQLELNFAETLKERRGFLIKEMIDDGACLFRAVCKYIRIINKNI